MRKQVEGKFIYYLIAKRLQIITAAKHQSRKYKKSKGEDQI